MASNPITQGAGAAPASSTSGQTINIPGGGTAVWPNATPTGMGEQSPYGFISPDPTEAANAWDLPANAGTLRLPTGASVSVPTSAPDRVIVTQSIQMVDLYRKFASGQKLTTAEVHDATQFGGDIARAAQLQGTKQGQSSASKAIGEISQRLVHVGFSAKEVAQTATDPQGAAKMKVPPQFATMLQNSGYGVTKNMTLDQMLSETSGPKAQQPLPAMSQGLTVGQYVQGLGNLAGSQIAQLQTSLYKAGMYDSSYYSTASKSTSDTNTITPGVLDTGTIMAFRKAMSVSLQTGETLEKVIGGNLPIPTGPGGSIAGFQGNSPGAAGSSLPGTSSTSSVPQTQASQLQGPFISAFEDSLGRSPSQQELATFTASYNAQQEEASKYATDRGLSPETDIDRMTGIPYVLTAPTATAAAQAFSMESNPVEYQATGIDNAFSMLMKLVDRQGTSALDTPGASRTATGLNQ